MVFLFSILERVLKWTCGILTTVLKSGLPNLWAFPLFAKSWKKSLICIFSLHLFNSFYPTQPPKNSLDIFTPTWFTSSTFLSKDDHRKIVAGTNSHQVIFHCKFFFHFGMNNWIIVTSGNATFLWIFSSLPTVLCACVAWYWLELGFFCVLEFSSIEISSDVMSQERIPMFYMLLIVSHQTNND